MGQVGSKTIWEEELVSEEVQDATANTRECFVARRGFTTRFMVAPAANSATRRSYAACRLIHDCASVPKYRARRNAVSAVMPRRSRTISLMRAGVTPSAWAKAVADSPSGAIYSSLNISPG